MKYIRTKDGKIYEIVENNGTWTTNQISKDIVEKALNGNKYFKDDIQIIKKADTIEELVDCYSYETETTTDLGVALGWKFANQSRHIYGCIKTNIGLIYVCEMNSEGNLRLFSDQTK